MKLTSKQINEIAQDLETGMKVFLNKETLEFEAVLDLASLKLTATTHTAETL